MAEEDNKQDENTTTTVKEEVPAEASAKPDTKKADAKKEVVKVPKEFEKLVSELDKLSALEISKFVTFLEEYWNVSAAPTSVGVAIAPAAGGGPEAPPEEAKNEYDIVLKDVGSQKVAVIKAVKDITGLGLGEAKALVDGAPKTIKEKAPKDEAEGAKKTLEEAGATVDLT